MSYPGYSSIFTLFLSADSSSTETLDCLTRNLSYRLFKEASWDVVQGEKRKVGETQHEAHDFTHKNPCIDCI